MEVNKRNVRQVIDGTDITDPHKMIFYCDLELCRGYDLKFGKGKEVWVFVQLNLDSVEITYTMACQMSGRSARDAGQELAIFFATSTLNNDPVAALRKAEKAFRRNIEAKPVEQLRSTDLPSLSKTQAESLALSFPATTA